VEPGIPRRVEDLFAAALELPAASRAAFLQRACAGNPGLHAELESLLKWHQRAEAGEAGPWPQVPREAESLSALVRARSLAAGSFGPFAVEVCLGEGATGIVYRAQDTRTDRTVALKVASSRTLLDPEGRRRFAKAAAASQRLDHPHIAKVFEAGEERGVPYLAMEYVEGQTLAGKLSLADALRIARQIAEALAAAHAQGIVHRDLKPANVMTAHDGGVKVLDFGLCHAVAGVESIAQTETGLLLGTPGYMAPELVRGAPPSPQSDLFSLGAVLYEMLCGVPAFRGETSMATISAVLHAHPARPAGVPAAALRLVERCLDKDPAKRPRNAAEVSAALARLERQVASGRLRARPVWDALLWRTSHLRPRSLAAGLAAALLVCAAAAGVLLLRAPRRMASLTPVTADVNRLNTEPALSPDRKWVAFASDRSGEGNLDLWIVPASGGAPRRLTRNEINTRQPEFSLDGRTLLFRSDRDGGGIYRTSVNAGTELPTAALVAAHGLRPRFSPDGRTVAFWTGIEGSGDLLVTGASKIFVVPAQGGPVRQICSAFSSAAYPIWSPDGKSILFAGRKTFPSTYREPIVWTTKVENCAPLSVGAWNAYATDNTNLAPIPERWLQGGRLLFRIASNLATTMLELRFAETTGRVIERAWRLGLPVEGANMASVLDESTMAMALLHQRTTLSTLPLDAKGGAGPPAPILECPSSSCLPALTPDGATLFYSRIANGWEFQRRDFNKPSETLVAASAPSSPWPFFAGPQLEMVYSRINPPDPPDTFTLYGVSRTTGVRRTICTNCPEPLDLSSSGRWLLGMSGVNRRTVAVVNLANNQRTELLAHPQWNLYRASLSPDERNVLFTAKLAADRSQILVADFREGRSPPPAAWIAISSATEYNGPAHWSPDGNRIYFTSERDGHRCFYVRPWDRQRHVPSGPIAALYHFHADAESPGRIPQSLFGFAVGRDKIVFPMGRQDGDIWLVN